MLPDLSALSVCPPCARIGLTLTTWAHREDMESTEKQRQKPKSSFLGDSPEEIESYMKESKDQHCPICLERLDEPSGGNEGGPLGVITLVDKEDSCGHSFHEGCLKAYASHNKRKNVLTCPSCRKPIVDDEIRPLRDRKRKRREPRPMPIHPDDYDDDYENGDDYEDYEDEDEEYERAHGPARMGWLEYGADVLERTREQWLRNRR
tara:strand:- start:77 stop:694 length:618 start_codon:yes stop_codon:yes gene_type:complete